MVESAHPMTRRSFVGLMVAAGLTTPPALADEPTVAVVHKDPNCGCCTGWCGICGTRGLPSEWRRLPT